MDATVFPGSWSLVKKNLPSLVGAGIGAIAGSIAAGRRAYRQQAIDARTKFDTWKGEKMPVMKSRRIAGRRYKRTTYRRPIKPRGEGPWKRLVRTSIVNSLNLTAASSASGAFLLQLSDVQTSDLTAAFKLFRLRKVVMHVLPRVDAANSGVSSNFQALFAVACDPESSSTPANLTEVTAYDNSYQKFLTSGDRLKYTFYPKAVNVVGNGGAAAYAGSYGMNPWLQLNATGIAIPHNALKWAVNTSASTTLVFSYYLEYHFDVKGIS